MIGNKIRNLRKLNNITQKQLAERSKISLSYIQQLELGKKENPSVDTLKQIASAFGMTINDLVGENNSIQIPMCEGSSLSAQINGQKTHRTKYDNQRDFLRSSGISFKRTNVLKGDESKDIIKLNDVEYSIEEFNLLMDHLIETVLLTNKLKKGE